MHTPPTKPESPCIRHCCLDEQDICMGCFRHLQEITGWTVAGTQGQLDILKRCRERQKTYLQKYPKMKE